MQNLLIRSLPLLCWFAQALAACTEEDLKRLSLRNDPSKFTYTKHGGVSSLPDDRSQYRATVSACKILGFSSQEIETLWNVVGAVLHLVRASRCRWQNAPQSTLCEPVTIWCWQNAIITLLQNFFSYSQPLSSIVAHSDIPFKHFSIWQACS